MVASFPLLTRAEILTEFAKVSPGEYAKTRNYLSGSVTRLSPYITHGIVRTPELVSSVLAHSNPIDADQLLKELIWKEYFLQVLANKNQGIFTDIEPDKSGVAKVRMLPQSLLDAETGSLWLDGIIREMRDTGYLHNHTRMWLASYLTHFGRLHWKLLADWTYYHFLDGDLASNHLSWQWVASTFSSKPYFFTSQNTE